MSFNPQRFCKSLIREPKYNGQLVDFRDLQPRDAESVQFPEWLSQETRQNLATMGIDRLYSHQRQGLDLAWAQQDLIITTGTSSGKSLVYTLPLIAKFQSNSDTKALWLFPTKALSRDQLTGLDDLAPAGLIRGTYDGDTPNETRRHLRVSANLLVSNLDMVHASLLPNHALFAKFFRSLEYIVIDEAHTLRGVFGSHASMVIRRLRRIIKRYGASPTFILSSATVPNGPEFAQRLVGIPFKAVDVDSSQRGIRTFALWNPPLVSDEKRVSPNREAAHVASRLMKNNVRTIVFCRSRRAAELISSYIHRELGYIGGEGLRDKVSPYRGGYLPSERREIEKRLRSGDLLCVTTTNALELGIDIGELEACVISGFPGSMLSVLQQSGRVGRRTGRSLTLFIAGGDALDQYYMNHPDHFYSAPKELAIVNPSNPKIMDSHLVCAALESPIRVDLETEVLGAHLGERIEALTESGDVIPRKRGVYASPIHKNPTKEVDLRGSGGMTFSIVEEETGSVIGTVAGMGVYTQTHPGAVYIHRGTNYEVTELRLEEKVVLVSESEGDTYTQVKKETHIDILERLAPDVQVREGVVRSFGGVHVSVRILGFARKDVETGDTLAYEKLDLPPIELTTEAVWYAFGHQRVDDKVGRAALPGALHAFEHAAIAILPALALSDRNDIGGVSTPLHHDTEEPTVFIYDGYEGGIGICEMAYHGAETHLSMTRELIGSCLCKYGCPSCVQSPKCGNMNEPLDKSGALSIVTWMIGDDDA